MVVAHHAADDLPTLPRFLQDIQSYHSIARNWPERFWRVPGRLYAPTRRCQRAFFKRAQRCYDQGALFKEGPSPL
jgi:hypothetical protein